MFLDLLNKLKKFTAMPIYTENPQLLKGMDMIRSKVENGQLNGLLNKTPWDIVFWNGFQYMSLPESLWGWVASSIGNHIVMDEVDYKGTICNWFIEINIDW